jgi:hypothetical protein
MAAQTWTTLQQTLLVALSQSPPPYNIIPPDFTALFPQATSYAEGRIYKDLVLLATRTEDSTSLQTTNGNRSLALSTMLPNVVIVQEGLALIQAGVRYWYDKATLDVIDLIWPNISQTMAPASADWVGRYWAPLDNNIIVMAPTPDAAYQAVIPGLFQPTPISAGNPSTYLSTVYPELLEAACMVWLTGALQRNFGSQADDPRQALSWEGEYTKLMTLAKAEEMRRRGLMPDVAAPAAAPAG